MTPKQEERIRKNIAIARKELADNKKRWGGFHEDSRGWRYYPPELFIKLRDYKGGLRYLRWFDRTFPDDSCYPIFLLDWTLILFKTGKLKEAEKKAMKTFWVITYHFDHFSGKDPAANETNERSNMELTELAEFYKYSKNDAEFADFREWLESFQKSEKFLAFANELMEIDKKLKVEPVGRKRTELSNRRGKLIEEQ